MVITNKKSLAFAALAAGASAQGWSNNGWNNQQNCAGTAQPFLCDDGYGHETTSIITVYPSGCPGYTNWNTWEEATSTTTQGWGSSWTGYGNPSATSTWANYDPKTTAWNGWNGYGNNNNNGYGNGNGNGNGWYYGNNGETTIIVTLTETFVIPGPNGWQTTQSVWYTTDCGCPETPSPSYTTYTTECPESWGVGPTVTVTIPIATWTPPAQTWEPASPAAGNTWNAYGSGSPAAASNTWEGYGSPAAASNTWSGYGSPAASSGAAKPVCPDYCGADNTDAYGKTCVYTDYVVKYQAYVQQCYAQGVTVYFYGKDYKLKPLAPTYCSATGYNVNGTTCSYSKYQVLYTVYVSDCTAANVTPYKWGYDTKTGAPYPPPVCSAKGMDKSGKPCVYSQYQVEYTAYQSAVAQVQSWASAAVASPAAASTWSTYGSPVAASSTGTWSAYGSPAAATASPSAWSPVKSYTGAASSTAVSSFMLVAGLIAGAALLL